MSAPHNGRSWAVFGISEFICHTKPPARCLSTLALHHSTEAMVDDT
ncbi:uncharacterized protein DNG_01573 [Cephalotrichum gorgonifer]|uniref:Uncharacterized protein n=1 Tax=Cephalotrichum gorgonifer TaxID=2041049 RepID=A0AAE8MRK2_9PEZI|nr:uncharacterized protein DNG_01573 [Cephalotrichum gorgonifer]